MRGGGREVSFALEGFELFVIVETGAIEGGFEGVEGFEVLVVLFGGGFGLDVLEELFAEFGEADGGTVVGLAFFVEAHEAFEVFGADLLPVVFVVAAGNGDDLDGAAVRSEVGEDTINIEVGVVEGGGDVAEEGFELGSADFVVFEKRKEVGALLGGDFDKIGSDEDLGVVATGEISDDLGLTLGVGEDGIVGEGGGRDGVRSGDGRGAGRDILKLAEIFDELIGKFV